MRAQYLRPLVVVSHNKGGAYIICELNGSVFDRPIAAFQVIPYFAQKAIVLPNLSNFLDIPLERLRDMEGLLSFGDDDSDKVNLPLKPDAELDTASIADNKDDDD